MQIVHALNAPYEPRRHPRNARFEVKPLLEGRPGAAGNYMLQLSRTWEDFQSPRHRHNFEQLRFQLDGVCGFARDGDMTPGTAGYFPEGTYYGPQANTGECTALVLQFGGPSGSGYMSESELQESLDALSRVGEIREGIFRRREGEGRRQQDAYEAAWENHTGRRLAYPAPRYGAPVLMFSDGFRWEPLAAGVSVRRLGAFEAGTAVSIVAVENGGVWRLQGPSLAFVLAGRGKLGGEAAARESCAEAEAGEVLGVASDARMEVLVVDLPRIAAEAEPAARREAALAG